MIVATNSLNRLKRIYEFKKTSFDTILLYIVFILVILGLLFFLTLHWRYRRKISGSRIIISTSIIQRIGGRLGAFYAGLKIDYKFWKK